MGVEDGRRRGERLRTINAVSYDLLAEEYYDPIHKTCRNFDSATVAALQSVKDRVPRDGLVLEVGCGSGRCNTFLKIDPSRIVQLDASREMLALKNREKCLLRVHGDAASIPLFDAQFEAVIGFLADPFIGLQFFAEAWRVLRPGGLLLVSTPTPDWGHTLRGTEEPEASYATFLTKTNKQVQVASTLIPRERLESMLQLLNYSQIAITHHLLPVETKPVSDDVKNAAEKKRLTEYTLPLIYLVCATKL
jgi:SAM-dependent methyltransferase